MLGDVYQTGTFRNKCERFERLSEFGVGREYYYFKDKDDVVACAEEARDKT